MVFENSGAVECPFTTPFKINNNDNDNNNNNDDESRCSNSITFSNAHHSLRAKILQSTKAMKKREYEWKVTK